MQRMIVLAWSFCTVDAVGLLKIALRKQKLSRAFNFEKQDIIDLNKNSLVFNKNFNIWSTFFSFLRPCKWSVLQIL